MVEENYKKKVLKDDFNNYFCKIIDDLKGKKVIIYGNKDYFESLYKIFPMDKLDIIAVTNKKAFKKNCFKNYKIIKPKDIKKEVYDYILVINEDTELILKYLVNKIHINPSAIKTIINDTIEEEQSSFMYLQKYNFAETLFELENTLKDKKVVLYGTGIFFETIIKYYDLSELNIIGIADRKFKGHDTNELFYNYPVLAPEEIIEVNPDYVLVATKFYIKIIYDIYTKFFRGTKIKIKPLLKKPFFDLLKEC